MAENARLAGELLKAQSQMSRSMQNDKEGSAKQFEEKIKTASNEKAQLTSDLESARAKIKVLESRIEDQKASLENAEKRYFAKIDFS